MYTVFQKRYNGKVVPSLAFLRENRNHAGYKKPVAPSFAMTNVAHFEPAVEGVVGDLMLRLDQDAESRGSRCEIDKWLQYFSLDVIGTVTFSRSFFMLREGHDKDNLLSMINAEFLYITLVGQMPWLDQFLRNNPVLQLLGRNRSHPLPAFAHRMLQRRLNSAQGDEEDFVSHLLAYQSAYPERMSSLALFGYITTNVVVGADATSVALRACIYFLCRHPRTLNSLRDELDNVSRNDRNNNEESSPATDFIPWATARKLPFLNAVINETLRLHPPGSVLSERVVPASGLSIAGVDIPPGTIVGMSAWLTQRDESIFGPEPDSFRPERWAQAQGESQECWDARLLRMRKATFVFGHGPRACIGKDLALLQLYKCVPALVQAYDMEPANPDKEWSIYSMFFARQSEMDISIQRRQKA